MLEIQVRKHCLKMFEGFERKIARNHKASHKKNETKTELNRLVSQSSAKQGIYFCNTPL